MSRYTVMWLPKAEKRLAELWLNSANQQAFADAVDRIERALGNDPYRDSVSISPAVSEIESTPIVTIFRVSDVDRTVQIIDLKELGPLPGD